MNNSDKNILKITDQNQLSSRQYSENNDIEELIITGDCQCIESECFSECINLKKVNITAPVKIIEAGAYYGCASLEEVKFNPELEEIGEGSFLSCSSLKDIELPNSLKRIKTMAFYGCNLSSVNCPPSIERIEEQAFWNNEGLKEVNIFNKLVQLGPDIFGSCYQLKRGYIACGYPQEFGLGDEVLYSLLILSTYEKHGGDVQQAVREYALENETVLMEYVLKTNNSDALATLVNENLIKGNPQRYLRLAFDKKENELAQLLLKINRENEDLSL